MSDVFVVIGMHRTGTSLVSSMLHAVGIPMCSHRRCGSPHPSQPQGHWEDRAFLRLNRRILDDAKGSWKRIPKTEWLRDSVVEHYDEMQELLERRSLNTPTWGWKEPRTTLLAEFWHTVLLGAGHKPHYIITGRDREEIVLSLIKRNGGNPVAWRKLSLAYESAILRFLEDHEPDHIRVQFAQLVSDESLAEAKRLAAYIGREDKLDAMVQRIQFRFEVPA